MHLVIHDLEDTGLQLQGSFDDETSVIYADGKYAACQGCFKCWLKNSGYCVIGDSLQHIGALFGRCERLTIISKITYGGYSSKVKKILDRSISTSLPFFTYRGYKTHHIKRYRHSQELNVYLYGICSELEKETARGLVEANRVNWGMDKAVLTFLHDVSELGGCLI